MGLKNFKECIKKTFSHNAQKKQDFVDDNGLTWKKVTKENMDTFSNEFKQLNNWSNDKDIQRYISARRPLNEVISMITPNNGDKGHLFFCYDNENLAGLLYTSAPYQEGNDGTIEYLIVNPSLRQKGYATMMTHSATHNLDFFFEKGFNKGIHASVEMENISSKRAFEKNGFSDIGGNTSSGRHYRIYYIKPRVNSMEK